MTALGGLTRRGGAPLTIDVGGRAKPMDAPIRRYVRVEEGVDRTEKPVSGKTIRPRRKKPFEAEYALLAELGLRSI